jgi:uncharacterized delta-60 repeat protein
VPSLAAAVLASAASAYPGALDPTFGHAGVASQTYSGGSAQAQFLFPSATGTVIVGSIAETTSTDGAVVVTRVDPSGVFDSAYGSVTPSMGAGWFPAGAVIEPSGRLVVAATGAPGNHYPARIELFGFDSNGHLDPAFGTGGTLLLADPGAAVRLFLGSDGNLHVAGASTASDSSLSTGLLYATVSPNGQELSDHTIPITGGDADIGAATPLPNGDVLFAGVNPDPGAGTPHMFLTELTSAGAPDPSFGRNGSVTPDIKNAQVGDVEVDGSGRILLAGAYIGNLGQSTDTPVNGLLVRFTPSGAIDHSFAGGGAPNHGAFEFSSVTQLADGSLLVLADGRPARFSASGEPDLAFGIGGLASIGRLSRAGPAAVDGDDFLFPGLLFPAHGFDNALALSRSSLTGTGIPDPVAKSAIAVGPKHGTVRIRVQLASRVQPLTTPTDARLVPRTTPIGDGTDYAPYAAQVRASSGSVALTGAGGSATVSAGTFTLRSVAHRVATLDFTSPGCGKHTIAQLNGPFMVTAGEHSAINTTHAAKVKVNWPCGGTPDIHKLSGQVTIKHFKGQPKAGTWFVPTG